MKALKSAVYPEDVNLEQVEAVFHCFHLFAESAECKSQPGVPHSICQDSCTLSQSLSGWIKNEGYTRYKTV